MSKKIGFVGCGNMGKAILGGIINSGFCKPKDIIISTKSKESSIAIKNEFNVKTTLDNNEVFMSSDIVILAIKPFLFKDVLSDIRADINNKIIVSIAAGITLNDLSELFGDESKVIRTMPNTPALVGEGMSAICRSKNISIEELSLVKDMFSSLGQCVEIEEKDFHGFIALCGSSPAYVFMFIEAMADAACELGIPRNKSYKMAAQSVLGSAKMVLETGKHPGELKDMVCSPSGTTIAAVNELERSGLRSSVIKGMIACADKSKKM